MSCSLAAVASRTLIAYLSRLASDMPHELRLEQAGRYDQTGGTRNVLKKSFLAKEAVKGDTHVGTGAGATPSSNFPSPVPRKAPAKSRLALSTAKSR